MASKNTKNAPRSYSSVASAPNASAHASAPAPAHKASGAASPPSVVQMINEAFKEMPKTDLLAHRTAFRYRMQSLAGKEVTADLIDGSIISGVLHATTLYKEAERKEIVIKACKVHHANGTLSQDYLPGATICVDFAKVVCLQGKVSDVPTASQSRSQGFATDSSIKKHGDMSHLSGRELTAVSSNWLDPTTTTSLSSGGGNWDQFEANKRLFNVSNTFDENLYTKKLDLHNITDQQRERAERLAREIEGSSTGNSHLQEERGHTIAGDGDGDEEALYSGVIRVPEGNGKPSKAETNAWSRGIKLFEGAPAPAAAPAAGPAAAPAAHTGKVKTPRGKHASAAAAASAGAHTAVTPPTPSTPSTPLAPPPGNLTAQLSPLQQSALPTADEAPEPTVAPVPAATAAPAAPSTPAAEDAPAVKPKLNAAAVEFVFKPRAEAAPFMPSFAMPPPVPLVAAMPMPAMTMPIAPVVMTAPMAPMTAMAPMMPVTPTTSSPGSSSPLVEGMAPMPAMPSMVMPPMAQGGMYPGVAMPGYYTDYYAQQQMYQAAMYQQGYYVDPTTGYPMQYVPQGYSPYYPQGPAGPPQQQQQQQPTGYRPNSRPQGGNRMGGSNSRNRDDRSGGMRDRRYPPHDQQQQQQHAQQHSDGGDGGAASGGAGGVSGDAQGGEEGK